ncbi:RND family transporter [Chloroflexota bacterium]
MERIARFIYKRSRLILILVAIINLAALGSFFRFELDTDFLSYFYSDNPRAEEYDRLNEKYNVGEVISVLIEQDGSLLEEDSLRAVYRIQEEIEALDGISQVQSFIPPEISEGGRVFTVDYGFIERHADVLEDFIEDRYFLTDQFLSIDRSKGTMVAIFEADAVAEEVLALLKEIVSREQQLKISLAGNEVIKDTILYYLRHIVFILPPCAVVIILSVFYLVIRDRKLTLLATAPAGLAVLWTFGTIFWSGQKLDLVTAISPIFVLVMGSAYGLHYVSHFKDNLSRYPDRQQLTIATLSMVGSPIFLATITTMAGFAALTWAEVIPMRQMGIFVSLGIGYAGLMSTFFLPAVLSRIKLSPRAHRTAEDGLPRLVSRVSRHRIPIVVIFTLVVVVCAAYIPRIEVVSNQLMFFKENSEIRQAFDKIEEHFGGALPLTAEIVTDRGINTLRDYNFANDILDTEREIERLPGIKSAFSIFDMVGSISKVVTGSSDYPENPQAIHKIVAQIDDDDLETWVSGDGFRMMIRTESLETVDMDELDNFVAAHPEIRLITGMPVLFDEMNRLVAQSQVQSLGLAMVLIFAMLLVTIRKLRAAAIALIPIVITVIAILGMLVMSRFHLNIMTANISAIAIGVGVDYSVHLISGINYFRKQGMDRLEAVDAALLTVSKPIIANAFGLAIGLSVLFFSPLRIHMQTASVMWVAMVVSSMAALGLIPIFYSGANAKKPKKVKAFI